MVFRILSKVNKRIYQIGFKNLFMDFYNSMRMVYPKECPYYAIANDICETNLSYETHYEEFV